MRVGLLICKNRGASINAARAADKTIFFVSTLIVLSFYPYLFCGMLNLSIMPDKWHAHSVDEVFGLVDSSFEGLSSREAELRLKEYGMNKLREGEKTSFLSILLEQFKDFLIILLVFAAAISIGIGVLEGSLQEIVEAALILIIVVFIVLVGFYQQYSAEKELEALKELMTPKALVLRDGVKSRVPAEDLVLGDVVFLEAGDSVPADLRLFSSTELKTDEASLTGESNPVNKNTGVLGEDVSLADRENMLYMSTKVVSGKGQGVIVASAMDTELGKIAGQIQDIKQEKTPLQNRLSVLGKQIGVGVVFLSVIVFLVGVFVGVNEPIDMFLIAVALAVAAVPEGLPGVVTVALAQGTRRMVAKNVIIRKLPAVETLGSTTVICTDKTGTLTKNEMTVKKIFVSGRLLEVEGEGYAVEGGFVDESGGRVDDYSGDLGFMLSAGSLACDATLKGDGSITGDPTEASIVVAAAKAGFSQRTLKSDSPRMDEVPFSSERKRKTTIHKSGEGVFAWGLGAPDVLLDSCSRIRINGVDVELTGEWRQKLLSVN
ncbi:MAG: HAD-IC family P-type ATPase, partial [Candidatus Altiarchaeales archaeon]|nr:HAD-IC family P-type ATPase [Candidatus Altiarchaeales archaeon]